MKHFKYSILTVLVLLATIGLVFAQPVPIGSARQPEPFESNPSAYTASAMGTVVDPTRMWDGDLASYGQFSIGSGFVTSGNLVVSGFEIPTSTFPIGWVDLKIRYHVPTATTDDLYRIEYSTDGTNWIVMLPDTGEAFDVGGSPPPTRPWAQIAPSDGTGVWTWAKLSSLQVRVWATRGGFSWDGRIMRLTEVWATVYPFPLPPTSSSTISLQPSVVTSGPSGAFLPNIFFVDVYVMDMSAMLGYEIVVTYDTGVLTAMDAFTYYPFKTEVVKTIDTAAGYVSLTYVTVYGDSVGFAGNTPIARIYFAVNGPALGLPPPTAPESALHFNVDKITDILGAPIPHATHDGLFQVAHYLSATDAVLTPITIDLTTPIGTHWHEIYPTYSLEYDLTSWTDNGDGILSASDQIDMYSISGGTTDWYHVDEVTITIWWTVKAGDPYGWDGMEMATEPEVPTSELITDPIGSKWHQIYPPDFYSLTFTITSWTDNGNGYFDESDQFDFEYDFDPGVIHWAHLDSVSTDIIVTPKPPPVPEFPLGLGVIMLLAPAIPIVYLWRTRKWVGKQ